ncbi:MAG: hypothetical protein LUC97_05595 [Clostridiales bacterium]|nr:hypothetical protein [Clostridiales bacterium]
MANTNSKKYLSIGNARILYPNFSGKPTKYNKNGERTFCVVIENSDKINIADLIKDGWNVKKTKPRSADEPPLYYIQVKVSFGYFPPMIKLFNNCSQSILSEDNVGILDTADISNIDVIISPYSWEINGRKGIKGYLKTMYVTIEEDEFAAKYADYEENNDLTALSYADTESDISDDELPF